jgi:large subunit ribosomal protein L1
MEYRLDNTANIHMSIGKASFTEEQLLENLLTVVDAIMRARPAAARGQYIRSLTLTSTMGPGIKVDMPRILQLRAV